MQPQVTLSIIIPSFNAAHTIVPVLLSLYKGIETAGISAEIIIVDANSTDSTCSIIKRLNNSWKENGLLSCIEEGKTGLEGVQLLNYVGGEESNIGFMLHQGFLKSSGSFVLFTTQDLILVINLLIVKIITIAGRLPITHSSSTFISYFFSKQYHANTSTN